MVRAPMGSGLVSSKERCNILVQLMGNCAQRLKIKPKILSREIGSFADSSKLNLSAVPEYSL